MAEEVFAWPKPVKRPKREPKRLQRKARLNARSKTKKASKRRDSAYLCFVRTLDCVCLPWPAASFCSGRVEASHVATGPNEKGTGLKVDDRQAIPHCSEHHRQWEERRGVFKGLTKVQRWERAIEWVAATQLKAIPEDYDQAVHFEQAVLGRIVVEGVALGPHTVGHWLPGNGS